MPASSLIWGGNDVAYTGDAQPRPAHPHSTVVDPEMGHQATSLVGHPGMLGAVAGVAQVEGLEVAPGLAVMGEQGDIPAPSRGGLSRTLR